MHVQKKRHIAKTISYRLISTLIGFAVMLVVTGSIKAGAAFGIAVVISSKDVTVWFSTAFKKSIVPAKSAEEILKAFCNEIVVCNACCESICPKTDRRVASVV